MRRPLGGVQDRAGRVLPGGLAAVAGLRHRVDVGLGGVGRDVHVGELALDELELADRLAELLALVDVGHHHVEAGLHDAERPRRQHRPLVVEARHQHVDAASDLAEHVLLGDLALLEDQLAGIRAAHAELVELLGGGESLHALLDQEGGDAAGARRRVGLGVDHQGLGDGAVGDPHLGAGQHVAVAPLLGAGPHRHHVRPGARLRHRERPDMLAGDELGQVSPLLRVRAVAGDLVDAQVGMRPVRQADRGGGARHLLHCHAMGEVAEAEAAVLLLDRDAVEPERPHLGPEVAREGVGAVDLLGPRRDLLLREAAHAVADRLGGLAQAEIELTRGVRDHRRLLPFSPFIRTIVF